MVVLIDRLLELAKLQADIYTKVPFDIQQLWAAIFEKYHFELEKQNFIVSVEDKLVCPYVMADKLKIAMVLNNLISNTIKYSSNQKMAVTISNCNNCYNFSIKNGITFAGKAQLDKMWEPFYVLEQSRNKQMSGTGLGLSIVRVILQKHQADFGYRVEQNEIEFYFSLPSCPKS